MSIAADGYFSNVRREIAPLLQAPVGRVLEVGCGAGGTLAWVKDTFAASRTVGLEIAEINREPLRHNADAFLIGDAASSLSFARDEGPYDVILFLDVLEHLVDPWSTLRQFSEMLAPNGYVIASIPNVGHWNVLKGLMAQRFRYKDSGILDRTHLRFFTREGVLQLMEEAGLAVTAGIRTMGMGRSLRPWKAVSRLSHQRLDDGMTIQFIVRGERAANTAACRWQQVWMRWGGV